MSNIEVIVSGYPHAGSGALKLIAGQNSFVLGIPESVLRDANNSGINTTFFTSNKPSYFGEGSLLALEDMAKINGLAPLIEETVMEQGQSFIKIIKVAQQNNKPLPFNGLSYGVSKIRQRRMPNEDETPSVEVTLHTSDHFTKTVMGAVYRKLRSSGGVVFQDDTLQDLPQSDERNLGFFFNSFGLNASVITEDSYVYGIRHNGYRHVPMNEGARPSAMDQDDGLDINSWLRRGLREELGLQDYTPKVSIRELFFVKALGQFGLHVLVDLGVPFADIKRSHQLAVDKWENRGLRLSPYTRESMKSLANAKDPTIDYTRDLWRNLALQGCPRPV